MNPYTSDMDDFMALVGNTQIVLLLFAALVIKADVSQDDNYDPSVYGTVCLVVFFSPVAMCIALVVIEWTSPIVEEWQAEKKRRAQAGLPSRGFCGFLRQLMSRNEEQESNDEATALTSTAADAISKTRAVIASFRSVSQRAAFETQRLLKYYVQTDLQLRMMSKWSFGPLACVHRTRCLCTRVRLLGRRCFQSFRTDVRIALKRSHCPFVPHAQFARR